MSECETPLSRLAAAYESSDDGSEPVVKKKFKDLPPAEKGLLEMVLPTNIISNTGSTWYCSTRVQGRSGWSGYYKCRSCEVLALALSLIFALTNRPSLPPLILGIHDNVLWKRFHEPLDEKEERSYLYCECKNDLVFNLRWFHKWHANGMPRKGIFGACKASKVPGH